MTRIRRIGTVAAIAAALSMSAPSEGAGQVQVGAHVSISDVGRDAPGLGARLSAGVGRTETLQVIAEAAFDVYFPSCSEVDCDAYGVLLSFLVQSRTPRFYQLYGGVGGVYQELTIQHNDQLFDGNDWGVAALIGNRFNAGGPVEFFIELRLTLMNESVNQKGLAGGARIRVGRGSAGS